MDKSTDDEGMKRDRKRFERPMLNRRVISKRLRKAETVTTRHAHRFILKRLESLRASRQHIVAWLLMVLAIIAVIGLQLSVSSQQYTVEAAVAGGTYAEGVVGKLDTLNPLYASSSAEVAASRLLFSSLYDYDATGHLRPSVATGLKISNKGRTYTVTLRDDVKWHDGAELTASDVAFTIETIKNPEARVRSSLAANWQSVTVKAVDTRTLVFTLPAYAAFPHALTFPIVPKHILDRVPVGALQESAFSRTPVGSGPFAYRLFRSADGASVHKVVHLTANERYFKGKPRLSRFELHAYGDSAGLVNAIKAHEVTSAIDAVSGDTSVITKAGYTLDQYPVDSGVYALMNTARGVFRDQSVRQALRMAVDASKVRQAAGDNLPQLDLPFITGQVEGAAALRVPEHNPDKAATLLDKAGWKLQNGIRTQKKQQLTFVITTIKNEQYERAANEVSRQLAAVGVKTTINAVDTTAPRSNFVQDVLQARNYDMLVYELPIGADPDVYAYWHSSQLGASGYNFTNYKNGVADAALVSARDRTEQQLRDAKYLVFATQWLQDAPAIGLYQQVISYAHNPNATSLADGTQLVSAPDRYSNVLTWSVDRARVYKTP